MLRKYIALYEYSYYGKYKRDIEFMSEHRANSKANKQDALSEIRRTKERGIARNAVVLETYLIDD